MFLVFLTCPLSTKQTRRDAQPVIKASRWLSYVMCVRQSERERKNGSALCQKDKRLSASRGWIFLFPCLYFSSFLRSCTPMKFEEKTDPERQIFELSFHSSELPPTCLPERAGFLLVTSTMFTCVQTWRFSAIFTAEVLCSCDPHSRRT